jgi:hypothetical protein
MSWMKFTSGFPRPDKKTQKKTEKWKISHWILRNIYEYITLINFSILLGVATVQNVVFGRKGPGVVPKDRWCAARVRWTRWTGQQVDRAVAMGMEDWWRTVTIPQISLW